MFRRFIKSVYEIKYSSNSFSDKYHEGIIKSLLLENGFNEISKNDVFVNNTFKYQPNGSQKPPDFIVMFNNNLVNLECKTSKTSKPVWNCSLPEPETMYIFSSMKKGTVVFKGKDIIGNENTNKLVEFSNKLKQLTKEFNDTSSNDFEYYCRNMFVQKVKFDEEILKQKTEIYITELENQYNEWSNFGYNKKF